MKIKKVFKNETSMNKLFIYGTLKENSIQLGLFGRVCEKTPARLLMHSIEKAVYQTGGKFYESPFLTVVYTPQDLDSIVNGCFIELTDDELGMADGYEGAPIFYTRIRVPVFDAKGEMHSCYTYMNTFYYDRMSLLRQNKING